MKSIVFGVVSLLIASFAQAQEVTARLDTSGVVTVVEVVSRGPDFYDMCSRFKHELGLPSSWKESIHLEPLILNSNPGKSGQIWFASSSWTSVRATAYLDELPPVFSKITGELARKIGSGACFPSPGGERPTNHILFYVAFQKDAEEILAQLIK